MLYQVLTIQDVEIEIVARQYNALLDTRRGATTSLDAMPVYRQLLELTKQLKALEHVSGGIHQIKRQGLAAIDVLPVQDTIVPTSIDEATLSPKVSAMVDKLRKLIKKGTKLALSGAYPDILDDLLSQETDLKYDIAAALNIPDFDDENKKYTAYGGRNTAELIEYLFNLSD